jgi:hypothetical protein
MSKGHGMRTADSAAGEFLVRIITAVLLHFQHANRSESPIGKLFHAYILH